MSDTEKQSCGGRCQCHVSRRKFLELGVGTLSAVALSGPALALLSGCGQQPLTSGASNTTGTLIPFSSTGVYSFAFSSYPQLQNPGGSVRVTIQAASGPVDVYVTRLTANSAQAVSTICTHAGCTLNAYDSTNNQYYCPCHGSIFDGTGNVVVGPAVRPLPKYATSIGNAGIDVTLA